MLTCILNASEGLLQIVVFENNFGDSFIHDLPVCIDNAGKNILCTQSWNAPKQGAEILTMALQNICQILKIQPHNIDRFACVHGPGSFTGIRLSMGTVAAIRRITKASNASIDYMQALALTAFLQSSVSNETKNIFCVITHAKRNLVHCQYFTIDKNNLMPMPLNEVSLCPPHEVIKQCTGSLDNNASIYILGSGYMRHYETFKSEKNIYYLNCLSPSPEALCFLTQKAYFHYNDLEPLYIRPCDAVENLNHIASLQGKDAQKSHHRLQEILKSPAKSL